MSEAAPTGIRCPECGVLLANDLEMSEHREVHAVQKAEGESTHPTHHCSFCSEVFRTPEALREHHRTAHGK
ncbi:MAG TPA: C2H2-type zinc finger protein [Thermoplasmata archaeon]|nr:C2H2-type zinc finger protein [Thermoplasmata archaeon]